ncbi:MAG: adenylate/guanylate cyclase domain-containing protein [Legionella sp.]|nr:adenylate/guanylate cyclase domain-containing protein [Legionella sp.]
MRGTYPSLSRLKHHKWVELSLGILCTIIILSIEFFRTPVVYPIISHLDGRIYDQIINLQWRPHKSSVKVVIINIDEESVLKEGRWPWPRDKMANLVNKLKQYGVVSVGMDIVMSEPEINYATGLKNKLNQLNLGADIKNPALLNTLDKIAHEVDNDQTFSRALLEQNVVLGFLFHHNPEVRTGALPPPLLNENGQPINASSYPFYSFQGYNGVLTSFIDAAKKAGFVTNLPDDDGTIRHAYILARYGQFLYPSLSLAVAMNYLLTDQIELMTRDGSLFGIKLDGTFIPVNPHGQILIPFWGGSGTLDYYSAANVLQGKVNAKELEGSIAIVGSSMALLADIHQTPVAQLFPGVEMVANMVQGMVSQQLITEYTWDSYQGFIYLLLFGIFFAVVFSYVDVMSKFIITLITLGVLVSGGIYLFINHSLYVPMAQLIILILMQALVSYSYSYIMEKRQKKRISDLFGQYVPQEYVKELIDSPENFSMEGQTREMTAQFTDIRNFTTVSEQLDAQGVKDLLNTFFTPITEIIFSQRGTVDKYVGDMIVAFWGAPAVNTQHAYHAILSSLIIFKQLPAINAHLSEKNLPHVTIGIGLASGLMNVGDMGSEFRRAYTVLGDTVNLASRLQDLTKFYQVNILTSDVTYLNQKDFFWRPIDKITVKGRKSALTIYEPLDIVVDVSQERISEVESYQRALEEYYAQNWFEAEKQFAGMMHQYPDCYLYKLYYERVINFIKEPPVQPWDGVYRHNQK